MAAARTAHLEKLVEQLGSDLIRIRERRDGWPALCEVRAASEWLQVAIHVSSIGGSGRGRDDVERRFQNPAERSPIQCPDGYRPLLIGVLYDGPQIIAVAGMDALRRIGIRTRISLFLPLEGLRAAVVQGWVERTSTSGEKIHIFSPQFLPVFASLQDVNANVPELSEILSAAGVGVAEQVDAGERARVAAIRAVRRHNFGCRVVEAYDGYCAMCGLDEGLVQGAHIYPVQAPGSPDEVWNGVALCANHHICFDRHQAFIHPESLQIQIHPDLKASADYNPSCRAFLETTYERLTRPRNAAEEGPSARMLSQRYEFFGGVYGWV